MKLSVSAVRAAMRDPFTAGHGTVSERELLLVGLEAIDGQVGHGEAAPLPSYDGVIARRRAGRPGGLPAGARELSGRDPDRRRAGPVLGSDGPRPRRWPPSTWRCGISPGGAPTSRSGDCSGHAAAASVPVNWTIASADRSGAAHEAAQARADGFQTVKVKVAIGDDAGRLAAVRAFGGPQMTIRIDANGAWEPDEAAATLDMLEPVGIELCEEPVAGVAAIRALRPYVRRAAGPRRVRRRPRRAALRPPPISCA